MGPRTSIRGNEVQGVQPLRAQLRFNGAADFHPRKRSPTLPSAAARSLLQWGRGLPSAETPAHEFKVFVLPELQWGRGLPSAETRWAARRSGARSPLQWGRGLPSAETRSRLYLDHGLPRFNGAADFHPRKLILDPPYLTEERSLQWGRGLPSAETQDGPIWSVSADLLQWGRGLPSAETAAARRFGRASESLQWGRGLPSAETQPSVLKRHRVRSLQWGRGLPSAETRLGRLGEESFRASMGPRTSIRGNMGVV